MSCEDHRQKAFAVLGQGNAAPLEAIYQAAAMLPAQASPKLSLASLRDSVNALRTRRITPKMRSDVDGRWQGRVVGEGMARNEMGAMAYLHKYGHSIGVEKSCALAKKAEEEGAPRFAAAMWIKAYELGNKVSGGLPRLIKDAFITDFEKESSEKPEETLKRLKDATQNIMKERREERAAEREKLDAKAEAAQALANRDVLPARLNSLPPLSPTSAPASARAKFLTDATWWGQSSLAAEAQRIGVGGKANSSDVSSDVPADITKRLKSAQKSCGAFAVEGAVIDGRLVIARALVIEGRDLTAATERERIEAAERVVKEVGHESVSLIETARTASQKVMLTRKSDDQLWFQAACAYNAPNCYIQTKGEK